MTFPEVSQATHDFFSENRAAYVLRTKILYSRTDHNRQYSACALNAGYLRLQTHTRIV